MSTYRERRLAKAERLFEWAEKRNDQAAGAYERSRQISDMIPFGQPILVGHHSEKRHRKDLNRIDSAMRSSIENSDKAAGMRSRAENIERAAASAIYSDDPDATEQLAAKIARLEEERDRIKRYNASCRKAAKTGGSGDLSILTTGERKDLLSTIRACPYMIGAGGTMPAYKLTNLSGNISRLRKRLEQLSRPPVDRIISARFDSECADCGAPLHKDDQIRYSKQQGARCMECES